MYHFFVNANQISDDEAYIEGADYNHIKNVLRLREGEQVVISDADGLVLTCEIESFDEDKVYLKLLEEAENAELKTNITLYQGLPKSDKFETIVQKCVELGVKSIVPVEMHRCVVKLDDKKKDSKIKRWNAISEAAAKQSGRGIIPEIKEVMNYNTALEAAKESLIILPYECAEGMASFEQMMEEIKTASEISVFIGPEGGFESAEVKKAIDGGAQVVSLGHRILRTETAGPALIAAIMLQLEINDSKRG